MNRVTILTAVLFVGLGGISFAQAQESSACEKFAWPLARERGWFAQTDLQKVATRDKLASIPATAFAMQLQPEADKPFVMPTGRKSRTENANGGAVSFDAVPRAGLYQVTVSDYAWIDVVQDGRYISASGNTSSRECAGVRKSIRVQLTAAPLLLQVSGVEKSAIAVAIVPAE